MAWNSHLLLWKKCLTKNLSLPDSTLQIVKKIVADFLTSCFFLKLFWWLEWICSQDFKTLVTTSAFLAATLIMVTLTVPCRAVYMWGIACLVCHSRDICDHITSLSLSLSLFPLFWLIYLFFSRCEPLNWLSKINFHLRKLGMKMECMNFFPNLYISLHF